MTKKKTKECEICGGAGWVPVSEDDSDFAEIKEKWGQHADAYITKRRCDCLLEKQFLRWVGPPIYNARKINESPLLGRENENLFITASRGELLSHLRFVLAHQDLTFFWTMTNDSDLRDIFVGNVEDYPSVSSFVKRPELVIIQLAVLSYKNVAMSGVVLEALRTRQFNGKPTWVVNPPTTPFRDGHLAWSPELEYFIDEYFDTIKIKSRASKGSGNTQKKKIRSNVQDIDIF